MELIRILLSRCAALFRGRKLDEELDEELRAHIELAAEEKQKRGMSEAEARQAALREFGGVTQAKEDYRLRRGLPFPGNAGPGPAVWSSSALQVPGICRNSCSDPDSRHRRQYRHL